MIETAALIFAVGMLTGYSVVFIVDGLPRIVKRLKRANDRPQFCNGCGRAVCRCEQEEGS